MAKIALPAAADWSLGTGLEVSGSSIGLSIYHENDDFGASTEQNILTGGDGAKSYGWNLLGSSHADAIDVNITNAGKLTINCDADNTGSYNSDLGGVFVYKNITGDFDASIYISTTTFDQNFEIIGLIARDPDASAGADWLGIERGYWATLSPNSNGRAANTVNSSTVESYAILGNYLRLVRIGDNFYVYAKVNSGDGWSQITASPFNGTGGACVRSTFQDTIQLGIEAVTNNTSDTFAPQVDYITILNGYYDTSPEAESPWIAIIYPSLDATTPIELTTGGTGSVKFKYALNNGSYNANWRTEAELKSDLASASITNNTNSLRIKAQFISDGSQQATLTLPQLTEYVQATGDISSGGGPLVGVSALVG